MPPPIRAVRAALEAIGIRAVRISRPGTARPRTAGRTTLLTVS
jgi:hypothetical protein